ncbi:MAG: preprotein translocase subunit SecG [Thermoleophilaceae bacterium]
MVTALYIVQFLLCVVLIVLVLLHSGKDAGLSGAFGVGATGSSIGAGPLLERNLTRYTIAVAILWVANVIVLLKI